jgi:hypothetical protein
MTHVVRGTTHVRAEDRGKSEVIRSYISRWLSLRNTSENISPERAIDAFRDGLIRRDFREELGRCKPKTIDHLMSLANEWADGEDSIANPRSRRRSQDHDIDPKDQLHSGSRRVRQKGHRGCYRNSDTADMVAATRQSASMEPCTPMASVRRVSDSTTAVHRATYPDPAGRPGRCCSARGCRDPLKLTLVSWCGGSDEPDGV